MKLSLVGVACLALGAVSAFADPAPDSVSGTVYHETSVLNSGGGLGGKRQWTVLLQGGGTFTYARSASATFVMIDDAYNLNAPPADGVFTYTRTGEITGTLALATTTINLTFLDASSGTVSGTSGASTVTGTFYLTAADRIATAPTSNLSLRGNATSGHPLIGGFVVPGSRPADVLVRVIGPSLASFGVAGAWADPDFTLYVSAPASTPRPASAPTMRTGHTIPPRRPRWSKCSPRPERSRCRLGPRTPSASCDWNPAFTPS